jgi:hypothetical protein
MSGKGLLIRDSNFSDNVASTNGHSGGALYIDDSNSVSIRDCSFDNNVAVLGDQNGGPFMFIKVK